MLKENGKVKTKSDEYIKCQNKKCRKKINLTEIINNEDYEKVGKDKSIICPYCELEQIIK